MKKNNDVVEIMDLENISFNTDEEPTNTTGLFDLEVDPLPEIFQKILEEAENE
jgi:hypothetical protein